MATPATAVSPWRSFAQWLGKSPVASFLRAFAATLLTLAVSNWSAAAHVSFTAWQSWATAALAAAIPVIIRWINPHDTAFGMVRRR